ncbi:MAG: exodeoxyribonuclease VII large subunit [Acidipropionibacterium sp.]|jgi:exodeoxyribonuclease VII large subunit|nr:exodeoxyribonuclease VII large subunit [Acidipropionibacterium sp.]
MPETSDADRPKSLAWVVRAVKGWVERCGPVWVQAQVIELNRRSGPTQFLTLRDVDEEISVTATCHRRVLDAAGPVETGMTVTALLRPTVWSKTGRLSFECSRIQPSGEGQLLAQLERRRRLLEAEGLFNTALHKPLPMLPRGVGLITGAHSDAERDVIRNATLRWPAVRFVVRNTLVQGSHAVEQILTALADLDADPDVDVIVIARGGGSLEDLLPFSDEALVRAVFAARTPVVSAIGHERDNPILDLVADLRASTPTDAGKRIVPDIAEETSLMTECRLRIRQSVANLVLTEQARLDGLRSRPVMVEPTATLDIAAERLQSTVTRMRSATDRCLDTAAHQIDRYLAQVRAMSPKATLDRGYAALADEHGDSVSSVRRTSTGARLRAFLSDGELGVLVESATPTSRSQAEEQS